MNITKLQKQLMQAAMDGFQNKYNERNPDEQIKLRLTPTSRDNGQAVELGLNLEMRKEPELLYTMLARHVVRGRLADRDILTTELYTAMFVQMMETALLIAVANLERQQHEKTEGSSNPIIN